MRNLKRVLTMIMAIAMTMSLMVVGAGAAFPDQDKVVNTEAVNMAVALGIIKGRDNGSFDPTGNVTRGEMAKMITIALNGGKDIPTGTQVAPTFSDIKGHWAEGYIEYCNTFGIVAGMGDGTFAPDASVTATQAAKMLLVAMGYDAKQENFSGANWAITINGRASQKQLYKGIAVDIHAPLNRDNAAQMIWNALQAVEVEYYYSTGIVNGQFTNVQVLRDKELKSGAKATMLFMKYDAYERIGEMTGFTYNSTKKEYKYNITHAAGATGVATFTSKVDYTHLFGLNTKVIYKSGKLDDVFGMFAEDSTVLYTGLVGDIEKDGTDGVKFDGKSYKIDKAGTVVDRDTLPVSYFAAGVPAAGDALGDAENKDFYKAVVVDFDGNGKVDKVVVTPCEVAEISYMGTKNVNFKTNANNTTATLTVEDVTIESGLKKGDYVAITNENYTAQDTTTVAKMDSVAGTVKATKNAPSAPTDPEFGGKIQVDGNWYTVVAPMNFADFTLNDKYTVYTIGSYAFFKSEGENKSITDVAYISAVDTGLGVTAKMYFADGTTSNVSIDDIYNGDGETTPAITPADLNNRMVTYSKDGGSYDVTVLDDDNLLGGDSLEVETKATQNSKIGKASSNVAGKFFVDADAYAIDDAAVVFIQQANKVKVVTGATAKTYNAEVKADTTPANLKGINVAGALIKSKSGVKTVMAAFIVADPSVDLPGNAGKSDNYAIVLGSSANTNVDGTKYQEYTIFNGKEEVTVLEKGGTARAEGAIITYTDLGDNKIDAVSVLSTSGTAVAKYFAVTGISGNSYILTNARTTATASNAVTEDIAIGSSFNADMEVVKTNDTVIIFVDTDADKGYTEGDIQMATENIVPGVGGADPTDKNASTNVFVYDKEATAGAGTASKGEAELIVVEINNKWFF